MSVAAKTRTQDPAHDVLRSEQRPLDAIFHPASVAVVGVTDREASVGATLLRNLLAAFKGTIYAVNPARAQAGGEVQGLKAYAGVAALPETPDLAVIVTPAETVPGIIGECAARGVGGAVVISAGFKETGEHGLELERQVREHLRGSALRLIGPNCLGVMNPMIGLNATFSAGIARPGQVAFLSQSGALCTAILDWSFRELVGFSGFVSTGSMLDVSWGDLIYHYGDDPETKAILIYMESVGDARSFMSAAREVALTKPIIVIKAGRTNAASKAAASHTGGMTGSDDVLDAAFRRCGVLRVNAISDLFYMAEVLSRQPRPAGPRLTIITNAGGPGVLATDALITNGGELAPIGDETLRKLDAFLPPHWSHANPIDILGDAGPERFAHTLEVAAGDPMTDGLLLITAPQGMTDPAEMARALVPYAKVFGKPVLASWMGGPAVAEGERVLNEAGIPTFPFPDTAARAFDYMWGYSRNLRGLYETPLAAATDPQAAQHRAEATAIMERVRAAGRSLLTEAESKRVLALYGIPTVETRVAGTADEAAEAARSLGFPVVVKLHSETLTHKTDVGGVQLNLRREDAVRAAFRAIEQAVTERAGREHFLGVTVQPMVKLEGYELILGSTIDPQFGPVMLFGSGGQLVEVYQDHALALPPLTTTLAARLMEQTRVFKALHGVRGRKPVDMAALERLLVCFSELVVEQRWVREMDVNPLLASAEGLVALDARIVVHGPEVSAEQLPKPAVRPYPVQYAGPWQMANGTEVFIRPIRPDDEPLLARFHETLSPESVYMRYFHQANLRNRVAHERLLRICHADYDRDIILVAERRNPEGTPEGVGAEIIGVARLSKLHGRRDGEFALLVSDAWQRHGIGSELLRRLIEIGRSEKLEGIVATILSDNLATQKMSARMGFVVRTTTDPTVVEAELKLKKSGH